MPVRIYDLAKKLGLESKELLAKAKELGIAAAKVPSSQLDKITAEYLESQFIPRTQHLATQTPPPAAPSANDANKPSLAPELISPRIVLSGRSTIFIHELQGDLVRAVGVFPFDISPSANTAENAPDAEIVLLCNDEGPTLEFKLSARWDCFQKKESSELQKGILKTIAAFMNTEGGTLLIGVADNGQVYGIEDDLRTLKGKSNDEYQRFLLQTLSSALGSFVPHCVQVFFHRVHDKEICKVAAKKAPGPVFVKESGQEKLFYRLGNGTHQLSEMAQVVQYTRTRWPDSRPTQIVPRWG